MQDFNNKVAVITGAASGIGLAFAELFAEQGMKIVLADIEQAALQQAVEKIKGKGNEAIGVVTDVASSESVDALAQAAKRTFGGIHIACNNAGVFTGGPLWKASIADYEWLMGVNQWGIIHGIRSFVPIMIEQGCDCHIVNTASMAGLTSMPYAGIYHMTKHAALALTECLYHELVFEAPQVGVSVLCPELVNTGIINSERNRPDSYNKPGDIPPSDGRQLANDSIAAAKVSGINPRLIAERTLAAIENKQFYILAEDAWRDTANIRLDDIRLTRNPTLAPPEVES